MKKVLFICLGNICRSPSAEGIFQHYIDKQGYAEQIYCDSAGIIGYHAGEPADSRMKKHALKRGYTLTSISRPFNPHHDFDKFDLIIGMDAQNIADLNNLARSNNDKEKIKLMTSFCKKSQHALVPDPYYGGEDGFEQVLDILEDACDGLLQDIIHTPFE